MDTYEKDDIPFILVSGVMAITLISSFLAICYLIWLLGGTILKLI